MQKSWASVTWTEMSAGWKSAAEKRKQHKCHSEYLPLARSKRGGPVRALRCTLGPYSVLCPMSDIFLGPSLLFAVCLHTHTHTHLPAPSCRLHLCTASLFWNMYIFSTCVGRVGYILYIICLYILGTFLVLCIRRGLFVIVMKSGDLLSTFLAGVRPEKRGCRVCCCVTTSRLEN